MANKKYKMALKGGEEINMKNLFISVGLIFILAGFVAAQDYEYGKPEDLKGLTRLYITTNGDIQNRDRIIKEIDKAKIGITIVDTFEEAQMFMRFNAGSDRVVSGSTTMPADDVIPVAITSVGSVLNVCCCP